MLDTLGLGDYFYGDQPVDWQHGGELPPAQPFPDPPKPPEMRSYTPSFTERLGNWMQDAMIAGGMNPYSAGHIAHGVRDAAYMSPLGIPMAAGDVLSETAKDNPAGAATAAIGLIPGAKTLGPLARELGAAARLPASEVSMGARVLPSAPELPAPTGKLNPLANEPVTFKGIEPAQFTPDDWKAFGEHYGTPKPLGPLSPLEQITDPKTGNTVSVPGGTGGEFTYYDTLHMKANPINPNDISPELHAQIQQKLGRTMTPAGGEPTDAQVWNGLIFGMTSPSNPLARNQLAQSRLRLRDPQMLDDLASMIPWKAGDEVSSTVRLAASKRIADRYGLGAAESGGLGVRGNADYTRIAELAQMFRENPAFFRKQPGEDWQQAVERISSQVPGLAMKTGSFGTVWQNPAEASVSAIDRHMVRTMEQQGADLFASPEQRADFERRAIERYNKGRKADDQVATFAELQAKPGTSDHIASMLLEHVGNSLEPKFRLQGGEINPNIPPHLQEANWVVEPSNVKVMGGAYKKALDINQAAAQEHDLGLFNSQWHWWDRIRQRLEPHENMFPGLEKTPALSTGQLREVMNAMGETGHLGKENAPTKPLTSGTASRLGYLAGGGLTLGGLSDLVRQKRKEESQ